MVSGEVLRERVASGDQEVPVPGLLVDDGASATQAPLWSQPHSNQLRPGPASAKAAPSRLHGSAVR